MIRRERIGYLAGVFDYCHQGHINIIKKSIENCDKLVVAVVSDNFANKYKDQEIKYNENQRVSMIKDLDLGVEIVIVDNNEHQPIYEKYGVTHLFHGTDWEKEPYIDFMGRESIENNEINVMMLPHTPNISSSKLRDAEQKDGKNANSTCCESE
tara:strand:+ start:149 stop:610 length:462 start_codon:yes stop_codon:yes gene_type:complete